MIPIPTVAAYFILQKKTWQPRWKPYTTLQAWKEAIYNAIFNRYATNSHTRKRGRTGKEEDIEDIEARQIHLQRDINHVYRGKYSDCLACKGYRQGQPRPFKKRKEKGGYLQPISGNQRRSATLGRRPDTAVKQSADNVIPSANSSRGSGSWPSPQSRLELEPSIEKRSHHCSHRTQSDKGSVIV
ncbi:hypothetical protein HZ326_26020 [Fusarium oxysporum f. sp. albedinis]|nr:hypothetical protein HZ326_26020 [Fusarium oxysporum f. sp. albedinis]